LTSSARSALALLLVTQLASSGCGRIIGADEIVFDDSTTRPCTNQRDCNRFGRSDPHVCRNGQCIGLLDDRPATAEVEGRCNRVLGAANLESSLPPFVFGAFSYFPFGAPRETAAASNYDLVVRQFTAAGGLEIQGSTHLPVAVVCDSAGSAELDRTFDHLTGTLGLQALLTPLPPSELKRSFERMYVEQGRSVFMLSPLGAPQLLSAIDDGGLLWHVLGPPGEMAVAYPPLIRRVEGHLRRLQADGKPPDLRLALVSTRRADDVEVASYIESSLILNGKSALQNGPDGYRRYTVKDDDGGRTFVETVRDLFEFRPHIVVPLAQDAYLDLIHVLEGGWEQSPDGQSKPFYVLSPTHFGAESLIRTLSGFPGMHRRVAGVRWAAPPETALHETYLRELRRLEGEGADLQGGESYFDAAYFLLYAAAAAGSDMPEPSGSEIAAGMPRLVTGDRISMGEAHVPDVLSALSDLEATIALEGTLGAPDFDIATGTRRGGEGSVWCVTPESETTFAFHPDVLVLEPSRSSLVGDFGCIPGF
jgi:hypothetical protein